MNKIIIIVCLLFCNQLLFAQKSNKVKTTLRVEGNCDMCKTRIEETLDIRGIQKAKWNKDTKELSLVFKKNIITLEDISKKIAAIGHDNTLAKSKPEVYDELHACCKYERKK